MRADEATHIFGLRVNVIVSVVCCVVALIVYFRLPKGQETPAEVDPSNVEDTDAAQTTPR